LHASASQPALHLETLKINYRSSMGEMRYCEYIKITK